VFKRIIIIFFIGILNINNNAFSDDKILKSLKEGKKLVFIRHAIAPGNGDPDNFDINDCSTQRNLDENGIEESKKIGLFFKNNKIKIDKVLSSQWCRCKDTAKYAFKNFETFDALNSFYDEKFAENETKQIKDLKNYIKNWNSDKNLVLITHFVVISSILNTGSSSGEIIISDKNFNIIGSIDMM
tara:strand:+ start:129 stop:683 length:555 start_codon:yes stop_codon:yes gene_type:complete